MTFVAQAAWPRNANVSKHPSPGRCLASQASECQRQALCIRMKVGTVSVTKLAAARDTLPSPWQKMPRSKWVKYSCSKLVWKAAEQRKAIRPAKQPCRWEGGSALSRDYVCGGRGGEPCSLVTNVLHANRIIRLSRRKSGADVTGPGVCRLTQIVGFSAHKLTGFSNWATASALSQSVLVRLCIRDKDTRQERWNSSSHIPFRNLSHDASLKGAYVLLKPIS